VQNADPARPERVAGDTTAIERRNTVPDAETDHQTATKGADVAGADQAAPKVIEAAESRGNTDLSRAPAQSAEPRIETVAPADRAGAADAAPKAASDTGVLAETQALKQLAAQTATVGDAGRSTELATTPLVTTASQAAAPSAISVPQGMQAQQAVLVASPSEIPDIVSRAQTQGGEDGDQRVLVRLDPPELGKVSIDFKFDAQGLQHVTITAETPEAIRRLREMHFELVQGLEQHGLAGQDMTFRQETPEQNSSLAQLAVSASEEVETTSGPSGQMAALKSLAGADVPRDASGRLNIRL